MKHKKEHHDMEQYQPLNETSKTQENGNSLFARKKENWKKEENTKHKKTRKEGILICFSCSYAAFLFSWKCNKNRVSLLEINKVKWWGKMLHYGAKRMEAGFMCSLFTRRQALPKLERLLYSVIWISINLKVCGISLKAAGGGGGGFARNFSLVELNRP